MIHLIRCTALRLDASLPLAEALASPDALQRAVETLCFQAEAAVLSGSAPLLVLSHRNCGKERLPIPSLLACGAVHQHLVRTQARTKVRPPTVDGTFGPCHGPP